MDVIGSRAPSPPSGDLPRELLLLVPPAIPMAVLFVLFVAERVGLNVSIHGSSGIVFVVVFYIAAIVALAIEIVAVPFAIWALLKYPATRTARYIVAMAFAMSFLVGLPIIWCYS